MMMMMMIIAPNQGSLGMVAIWMLVVLHSNAVDSWLNVAAATPKLNPVKTIDTRWLSVYSSLAAFGGEMRGFGGGGGEKGKPCSYFQVLSLHLSFSHDRLSNFVCGSSLSQSPFPVQDWVDIGFLLCTHPICEFSLFGCGNYNKKSLCFFTS